MPVSKDTIYSQFKTLYLDKMHLEVINIPDSKTGVVEKSEVLKSNKDENIKDLVECLIDAILLKIKSDGLEMGESTATKLEVQ